MFVRIFLLLASLAFSEYAQSNCPVVGALAPGQSVSGQLLSTDCVFTNTDINVDVYSFSGTAGQAVSIAMTSSVFDSYLLLTDPNGDIVGEDDDSGGGTNARIPATGYFTLPATGTYQIYANSAFPGETGTYLLTLNLESPATVPTCTLVASPPSLILGETVVLTAACNPAAVSYIWTGGGCTSAGAICRVNPSVTTTYTVTGTNATGRGNTANVTVNVSPPPLIPQTITFSAAPSVTVGGNGTVSASASSGLEVTFSSLTTGICTISGSTVTGVAAGACTIAANQTGNGSTSPAVQVTQTFAVDKNRQTISFVAAPSSLAVGGTGSVNATASSGLPVTFSSLTASICSVSGTTVSGIATGTCTVAANQAGNNSISPAAQVTQTFAVDKTPQTISFVAAPSSLAVGGTGSVNATASSGLPVTFSSLTASICSVSGTTVSGIATGTCTIAANQTGNSSISPAAQVTQTFAVDMSRQTISFVAAPSSLAVGGTITVNATASSGLPVTFSSLTASICSVSGTTVSGIATGTCTIAANQAGNGSTSPAAQVTHSFSSTILVLRKAIEFYQSTLKHYFITLDAGEAVGIDAGAAGPGWTRTGGSFNVWSAPASGSQPVCRFYGSPNPGPNSHFFTVDADECAALRAQQAITPETVKKWHYEGIAFYMAKPLNAACAGGTVPVYRYYNNGYAHGDDANHRLTTDLSQRGKMEANGWSQEGTVMCAEVSTATAAFTFNAAALFKGQAIAFTDTSTGRPTAWYWTFGDGSSSSVQHPVHLYSTAGTFVVTLTTSTAQGGDYTASTLVIAEQGSGGGDGGGGGGGGD